MVPAAAYAFRATLSLALGIGAVVEKERRWKKSPPLSFLGASKLKTQRVDRAAGFPDRRGSGPFQAAFIRAVSGHIFSRVPWLRLRLAKASVIKLDRGTQDNERTAPPGPICGNRISRPRTISRAIMPPPMGQ